MRAGCLSADEFEGAVQEVAQQDMRRADLHTHLNLFMLPYGSCLPHLLTIYRAVQLGLGLSA